MAITAAREGSRTCSAKKAGTAHGPDHTRDPTRGMLLARDLAKREHSFITRLATSSSAPGQVHHRASSKRRDARLPAAAPRATSPHARIRSASSPVLPSASVTCLSIPEANSSVVIKQLAQDAAPGTDFITFEEVQEVARRRGLSITLSTLGPLYRIVCRQLHRNSPAGSAGKTGSMQPGSMQPGSMPPAQGSGLGGSKTPHNPSNAAEQERVVAVTTGFVAPWLQLMHCDTLQVMTKGLRGEEALRVRGTLGLGLLLGGATFSYGISCGCSKAEILAINDDDAWHERLVRYYRFFGFTPVTKVGGNGLSDLPHMLVWGGEGLRMDADIKQMLRKWTPALRRSLREGGAKQEEQEQQ